MTSPLDLFLSILAAGAALFLCGLLLILLLAIGAAFLMPPTPPRGP